ncbi:MAG: alpha/beta fold hydrolase [Burkholderiales bacterium]|nr:alpha/beta fold hydrolase [Burkholderiales bacterium]
MNAAEPVVVVHGLWMQGLVMGLLARRLGGGGFAAHTWSYPTLRGSLGENAARLARHCMALAAPRVHIVAHSMGGLVALRMLERHRELRCGRLVLLGTPYGDSFSARRLARFPGGRALLGRSIAEWLDGPRPLPRGDTEIGVIAGTRGFGLGRLVAPDLPRPNDGVVTLQETAVPGVTERIELDVGHTGMLLSRAVARQCAAFLRHGRFSA